MPTDVSTFAAEYPSLARKFYGREKACAPPFRVNVVEAIAEAWPLRKPKDAELDAVFMKGRASHPADRMDEGVRVVGTTPGTTTNAVGEGRVPMEKPVTDVGPCGTIASALAALLDRDAEKKRNVAKRNVAKKQRNVAKKPHA